MLHYVILSIVSLELYEPIPYVSLCLLMKSVNNFVHLKARDCDFVSISHYLLLVP